MAALYTAVLATLLASASGGLLRHDTGSDQELGLVRPLTFNHALRVCNAFPVESAMDVYRSSERLTASGGLAYKDCMDFHTQLKTGDKLEFRVGEATAGTFSVSDLPSNDAVLLLVVHRHDALSTAVAFESHVFANSKDPQVAVIDAYKGAKHSSLKIMDRAAAGQKARSEELRYDSVVAVGPGEYEVELGANESRSELVALRQESYVVLRTGVEAKQGRSFPEELVVFPRSDPTPLERAAASLPRWGSAVILLVIASFVPSWP